MNPDEAKFNRRFLAYFAVGLTIAAMTYLACITFLAVPPGNARFADTVLGFILGTVLATPLTFFYGSSRSSQSKDQALQQALVPSDVQITTTTPKEAP